MLAPFSLPDPPETTAARRRGTVSFSQHHIGDEPMIKLNSTLRRPPQAGADGSGLKGSAYGGQPGIPAAGKVRWTRVVTTQDPRRAARTRSALRQGLRSPR
jgi:hypothetical protein